MNEGYVADRQQEPADDDRDWEIRLTGGLRFKDAAVLVVLIFVVVLLVAAVSVVLARIV